ncbi:MAG: glutathione-disulfide reductase [Xanthomonadales bacterium]|nr:glutathione-disulfide reductase [Xanthomonadales bacterium]
MSKFDYDLFVIGAGSGGVRASRIAAGYGAKVGICEESRVGGTCVIRGCVPKKLMTYAAHFSEDFKDAQAYGWDVVAGSFDWSRFIAAKDKEIDRLNDIYINLLSNAGVDLLEGRGVFIDRHTLRIGEQTVTAKTILIAVGGRPFVPEFPGRELVITSDEAFHLNSLPERVVVVGGGFIATEFAGIFNGLGSEVTQIYRGDALLRGFDEDVRAMVTSDLGTHGIDVRLECGVEKVTASDAGSYSVHLNSGKILAADQVMYATGRFAYTPGLNLEAAGVIMQNNGAIPVDEFSATNVANIYAVGDVTDRINLTPVALHEGHAFADTVYGKRPRSCDHRFVPSAVFSNPAVATVGYTESDAREVFAKIKIFRTKFRHLKHSLTGSQQKMMMKLVVCADTDRVVGLHVVGQDAAEIVQGFAVAVKSGLSKADFDATIGIHPTAAEELVTLREPVQS